MRGRGCGSSARSPTLGGPYASESNSNMSCKSLISLQTLPHVENCTRTSCFTNLNSTQTAETRHAREGVGAAQALCSTYFSQLGEFVPGNPLNVGSRLKVRRSFGVFRPFRLPSNKRRALTLRTKQRNPNTCEGASTRLERSDFCLIFLKKMTKQKLANIT